MFNVFYILNLGLSEEEEYEGPVYGKLAERGGTIVQRWRWPRDEPFHPNAIA